MITAGGGGIPVYREEERLVGVEAVIDKDLASALTAVRIGADEFYILTDVPKVYVNFRKPDEKALDTITVAEAERYIEEKQFSEGSMLPKVKAALYFVRNGGKECVITDATQARCARWRNAYRTVRGIIKMMAHATKRDCNAS